MDKTIEEIFKVFNHLARELQIYFLSGFIILLNIFMIDFLNYESFIWKNINAKQFIIPLILIAYILGQICLSFYCILLEVKKVDQKLNKFLNLQHSINYFDNLTVIFKKDKEVYLHFVERYSLLSIMRWNLSAAFFINFLVNLGFIIFIFYKWQLLLAVIINFVFSFLLYVLSVKTEKEYAERIDSIIKSNG